MKKFIGFFMFFVFLGFGINAYSYGYVADEIYGADFKDVKDVKEHNVKGNVFDDIYGF